MAGLLCGTRAACSAVTSAYYLAGAVRVGADGPAVRLCDVPDRAVEHRLAVLLALGPLFVALLLFDGTRRFFEAWLAQLANYALITILTVLVAALLLQIVAVLCRTDGRARRGDHARSTRSKWC